MGTGARTLNEMWQNSAREFAARQAICIRRSVAVTAPDGRLSDEVAFRPVTYRDLAEYVESFGRGLIEIGLDERQPVALLSENCLQWLVCDLAVLANRAFDVPRGSSFPSDEVRFILTHSEARVVAVQDADELERLQQLRPQLPTVQSVVVLDETFRDSNPDAGVYSFDDIMRLGRDAPAATARELGRRRERTGPDDLATLMYTSGTTGDPKGIPLTHANIMHNVGCLPAMLHVDCRDRFLSFLPIWHVLERTTEYAALCAGASTWYTTGMTLARDLGTVRPTCLVSVPYVWKLLHDGVIATIKRSGREKLFSALLAHSEKVLAARRRREHRQYVLGGRQGEHQTTSVLDWLGHWLGDMLVYRKVRRRLGGCLRAGVSGGGALPEYLDDFFEIMGVVLLEGYGLTETAPVLCVRTPDHRIPYTVGKPLPGTALRIRDENGNDVDDGQTGIVWAHGPQIMAGYFKNPEETARVMEDDNAGRRWFNTGDLGCRTQTGDISITGRVKDTIVLFGGENVEPGRIEAALLRSDHIDQVMVCGQDQEYLTALIVPNPGRLRDTCSALGLDVATHTPAKLARNDDIHDAYMEVVSDCIAPETGFREIELIHNLTFVPPFAPADDTLTLTRKLKRHTIRKRDRAAIRSMYPRYNSAGSVKGGNGP